MLCVQRHIYGGSDQIQLKASILREFFANCDKKLQGSAYDSKLSISFAGKQSFAEQMQFKYWLLLDVGRLDV